MSVASFPFAGHIGVTLLSPLPSIPDVYLTGAMFVPAMTPKLPAGAPRADEPATPDRSSSEGAIAGISFG
ncbi:hypothetical protein CONPUDRAFT_82383 [Coniophora puteana RWD-64-598 SS2]|uniref:Uncharacterized protein n=1 Tax=Coniophora puteana (strain RWD-64-598) TaxID=741705 RepID=A0A5M3MRT8_CONPW|nr:uncharacterized protein CONPUDRAFT_82383 [Coniophora puteana RWD-64-598 SS2]EIW81464.1 hypothetical protein CONPUDRAFT_82383 [Coniophora puteana RWD-64-598 SS2]